MAPSADPGGSATRTSLQHQRPLGVALRAARALGGAPQGEGQESPPELGFAGNAVPRPLVQASFWPDFPSKSFSQAVTCHLHPLFCFFLLLLGRTRCCFCLGGGGWGEVVLEKFLEGARDGES